MILKTFNLNRDQDREQEWGAVKDLVFSPKIHRTLALSRDQDRAGDVVLDQVVFKTIHRISRVSQDQAMDQKGDAVLRQVVFLMLHRISLVSRDLGREWGAGRDQDVSKQIPRISHHSRDQCRVQKGHDLTVIQQIHRIPMI